MRLKVLFWICALVLVSANNTFAQIPPIPAFRCDLRLTSTIVDCGLSVTRAQAGNTDMRPTSPPGYVPNTFGSGVVRITPGRGWLVEESRTNFLLNSWTGTSAGPVTRTTGTLPTGSYVLWVNEPSVGSGSATISAGTATGCVPTNFYGPPNGSSVATTGSWVNFVVTVAGTCTVTVAGTLTAYQLESCGVAAYTPCLGTSLISTTATTVTRPAEVPTVTNAAIKAIAAGSVASLYVETDELQNLNTANNGILLSSNNDIFSEMAQSSNSLPTQATRCFFGATLLQNNFGPKTVTNIFTQTMGASFVGNSTGTTNLIVSGINAAGFIRPGDTIGSVSVVSGPVTGGNGTYVTSAPTTFTNAALTSSSTSMTVSLITFGVIIPGDGNFVVNNTGNVYTGAVNPPPGMLVLSQTSGKLGGAGVSFTGNSTGTTTLTISAPNGVIGIGATLGVITGVPPNTHIIAGPGGGGAGTYTTDNTTTTTSAAMTTTTGVYVVSKPATITTALQLYQQTSAGGWGLAFGTMKAAIGWDGTGRSCQVNNSLIQSDAAIKTAGDTSLFLGGSSNTAHDIDGYVRIFEGWSTRLTNDQLTYLTQQNATISVDSIASSSQILNSGTTIPPVTPTVHQGTGLSGAVPIPAATAAVIAKQVGPDAVRQEDQWVAIEKVKTNPPTYDFSSIDPYAAAYLANGLKLHMLPDYGNQLYFSCANFFFCNTGNVFNVASSGGADITVSGLVGFITSGDGNQILSLATGVPANTHIISQSSGTTGSNGTYQTDNVTSLTGTQQVSQPLLAVNNAYAAFAAATASHYDAMSVAAGVGHVVTTELSNEVNCGQFTKTPSSILYAYQVSVAVPVIRSSVGIALGGVAHVGDFLNFTVTSSAIAGSPLTVSYVLLAGDTLTTAAVGLTAAINANSTLSGLSFRAAASGGIVSVWQGIPISPAATYSQTVTGAGATTTMTLGQPQHITSAGMGSCGAISVPAYMGQFLTYVTAVPDALGNHPYQTQYPPEPVVTAVQAYNAATNNISPQWDTEQGYTSIQTTLVISESVRATYVARLLLMELTSGVQEIAYYAITDVGVGNPGWGLFANSDLPQFLSTLSATAFTNVKAAMNGATAWSINYYQNSDTYLATFTNSLGTNAVIWSPSMSVNFTWNAPVFSSATGKDVLGFPITPIINGNAYTVPLGGGDPIIVTGLN